MTSNGKRNAECGTDESVMRHPSSVQSGHPTTRCSFCAHEFTEEEGQQTCSRCASFGGCKMVMCPRCGYEMPQTPKLIKMIRQWRWNAKAGT